MNSDITSLMAFEKRRQAALISADVEALSVMLADDLIHIHSTGLVHNKVQFIEHIRRMGGFISISRAEPQIQICGDIAMLTGPTRNAVRLLENGKYAERHGFSTLIARRTLTDWEILLSQLTPILERTTA
ncbi:nuclear transport factor 2 family protein [Candidatus Pantoea formicae]|uniref:nuclear transport factor 2 family protein n=1 Tax=Candidatus Pantoea formicae TaxID=2608355 RepID=UPI003ED9F114